MTVYDAGGAQVGQGVSTDSSLDPLVFPLPPGDYTVCETEQSGWYNTDPGTTDPNYGDRPCKAGTLPDDNPGATVLVQLGNSDPCFGVDAILGRSDNKLSFDWSDGYAYDVYRATDDPYFATGAIIGSNVSTGWVYIESLVGSAATNAFYVLGDSESCGDRVGEFDFTLVPGN